MGQQDASPVSRMAQMASAHNGRGRHCRRLSARSEVSTGGRRKMGTEARQWSEVKGEQWSAEMMECNDSRTSPSQPPKTSGCHWPDDIRTN